MEDKTIVIDVKEDSTLSELLINWKNINIMKKELLANEEKIRNKIKIFLKEHQWKKHTDESTNITIELIQGQTETFDKAKLQMMLTDVQYQQVKKITTYEKLMIMTSDDKERMKKFLKPPRKQ
jgi:hypothetical protein